MDVLRRLNRWAGSVFDDPSLRWVPGGFSPLITLAVHLALMYRMTVRGMDYATGESAVAAHRLGAVESAAPLWLWGIAFTLTASLGFAAMSWRWSGGVVAAHVTGCALHAAVAVGLVIDTVNRVSESGGHPTWVVAIPLVAVLISALGAWRHGGISISITVVAALSLAIGWACIDLDGLRNATELLGSAIVNAALAIGTAQVAARQRIRRELERRQE